MVAHSQDCSHKQWHPHVHTMLMTKDGAIYNLASARDTPASRSRRCRLCCKKVNESVWLKHQKSCRHVCFIQDVDQVFSYKCSCVGPHRAERMAGFGLMELPGYAGAACVAHVAAAGDAEVPRVLDDAIKAGKRFWTKPCRDQKGEIYSCGVSITGQTSACYQPLRRHCVLFHMMTNEALAPLLKGVTLVNDLPQFNWNMDFGIGHQTCMSVNGRAHPPPPAVAARIGAPSCLDKCEVCSSEGCVHCPECAIQVGQKVGDLSVVYQHQPTTTPEMWQGFVCVNGYCYTMRGGVFLAFSGVTNPHGVWAPDGVPDAYRHRGFTITSRALL